MHDSKYFLTCKEHLGAFDHNNIEQEMIYKQTNHTNINFSVKIGGKFAEGKGKRGNFSSVLMKSGFDMILCICIAMSIHKYNSKHESIP